MVANGYVGETQTAGGMPFQLVTTPVQFDGVPAPPNGLPNSTSTVRRSWPASTATARPWSSLKVGRRRGLSMRVGVHLPQYGRVAGPDAITRAAMHAEELGFLDVWVSDHIVHPAAQDYPSPYLFDPLITLTWAAAVTERIGLGTSVLVVPTHNPLELANALASLDALSAGRLTVAVGVGWSEAEYAALGATFRLAGLASTKRSICSAKPGRKIPSAFMGPSRRSMTYVCCPSPVGRSPSGSAGAVSRRTGGRTSEATAIRRWGFARAGRPRGRTHPA